MVHGHGLSLRPLLSPAPHEALIRRLRSAFAPDSTSSAKHENIPLPWYTGGGPRWGYVAANAQPPPQSSPVRLSSPKSGVPGEDGTAGRIPKEIRPCDIFLLAGGRHRLNPGNIFADQRNVEFRYLSADSVDDPRAISVFEVAKLVSQGKEIETDSSEAISMLTPANLAARAVAGEALRTSQWFSEYRNALFLSVGAQRSTQMAAADPSDENTHFEATLTVVGGDTSPKIWSVSEAESLDESLASLSGLKSIMPCNVRISVDSNKSVSMSVDGHLFGSTRKVPVVAAIDSELGTVMDTQNIDIPADLCPLSKPGNSIASSRSIEKQKINLALQQLSIPLHLSSCHAASLFSRCTTFRATCQSSACCHVAGVLWLVGLAQFIRHRLERPFQLFRRSKSRHWSGFRAISPSAPLLCRCRQFMCPRLFQVRQFSPLQFLDHHRPSVLPSKNCPSPGHFLLHFHPDRLPRRCLSRQGPRARLGPLLPLRALLSPPHRRPHRASFTAHAAVCLGQFQTLDTEPHSHRHRLHHAGPVQKSADRRHSVRRWPTPSSRKE